MNLAWHRMRKNHLFAYPTCAICDDPEDPCVHHLRYRGPRGESEVPGDLMTLCRFHHDDFHAHHKARQSLPKATMDYVTRMRFVCEQEAHG